MTHELQDDVAELVALYEAGAYSRLDFFNLLAELGARERVSAVTSGLPASLREDFHAWAVATFDNDTPADRFFLVASAVEGPDLGATIVRAMRAWLADPSQT